MLPFAHAKYGTDYVFNNASIHASCETMDFFEEEGFSNRAAPIMTAAPMNPKKMKVSELRAALESRGLSSNGLKTELIQRLELALDEEEFGSEAQEMEELKVPSPKKSKKPEPKKKDAPEPEAAKKPKAKTPSPVKKASPAPAPAPVEKEAELEENKDEEPVAEKEAEKEEEADKADTVPEADGAAKPMTEEEKRAARAAKFGIPLSLEDKKVGNGCLTARLLVGRGD
ncbi:unnamed protein product [Phytophthora fragariaefolia]|uniref:Unnamed protein product n=1 Tax=Phytophthora fragariaefolia TaxID=1490495 RepID=A0A9W6Y062_9STRA|nr:unnamed protein product [Phytophthora fragariaefolia]